MPEVATISTSKQTAKDTAVNEILNKINDREINKEKLQRFPVQTKLTVGAPDDPYEKEADSVADSIMRMPDQNFVQRKCAHCEEEEKKQVRRKPISQSITGIQAKGEVGVSDGSLNNKINSSKGSGIDSNTQSFMQNRFGTDFGSVKIHTDGEAIQMNQQLNAKAFTAGNDVYFNEGQYQPGSDSGRHLLAHELTHVLQQSPNAASASIIQRKEVEVPEMDTVPEWKPSGDREFQWQNKGLRDIIYPEREQSLRAFLEIVKELELSGSLDPTLGLPDKAAIKKNLAAYVEQLKKMDHDALVVETMQVFKKFKNTPFFPDWVRYTVIHYSGMRYESAHSTWVAPQGLLAILKERERIEADEQHKNFMSAKGRQEFIADPKLTEITDRKKKQGYIDALNATQPSVIEKKLSAADKAIHINLSQKEEEWYDLTFTLSELGNEPQKIEETLKKIQVVEKDIDDMDAKLSEKGRKLVVAARKKRLELFQRIHLEIAKERLKALSEEEALFLLSQMHDAGQIPEPVWKEIVSFTQLRVQVKDASELVDKNNRMLKGIKESDKITKDQLDVWKVLLKMWYESSGGTKWREDHRLTLSPSIVTSLVCDQLGSKVQNIRGVSAPGGLRGNAQAFYDAAKKSTSKSASGKWDGKTACPPAPISPFFKIPQQIEDFPCGASIFWAGWSDLNISAEYRKVYENEEKPLLNTIKKLKDEIIEKEKFQKDKKDLEEAKKKKTTDLKPPTAKDKDDLKKIEKDLKKIEKLLADKDKRFKEIDKQLPMEEAKLEALKKRISAMEVFLPEKDKTPDYSNTFVPFDSPDLEMKEGGKQIVDGMKDGEGWTYSVNDKRLVAGHPTKKPDKDKPAVNIPVKTIMRVKPNLFYCPDGEKSCPLDFSENKNKKLIKQWMIWKHEATVMFVMPTKEIITYDTSGSFNNTQIKGMSAQRRNLNSLLNPDRGHRIFVGFAPESKPKVDPTPFLDEGKILSGIKQPTQPSATQSLPSSSVPAEPPPVIQPKLFVGQPDDKYEKEADAVANTVMRMPEKNFVQRKCAHCEEEEKKQVQRKPLPGNITPFIQTKGEDSSAVSNSLSNQISSSKSNGSNMDDSTESFMSSRFGTNFNQVKIHTDNEAIQMNRELKAKAFTVGNDIYFNEGQYQPGSDGGKHLLAHELVHTVQQGKGEQMINKAPVTIDKRSFNDGNIVMDTKAKTDLLKFGNLLTGKDQAHIAVSGNKLAYETTYTNPEDPFRWDIVKKIIDSENVEIKGVDLTTVFDTKVITFSGTPKTRTEIINKISLASFMAGGITLPTEAQQLKIDPSAATLVTGTSTTSHQLYYETGKAGRGVIGSNSLAHEFFGHLWLAINGVPYGHRKTLTAAHGIKDPFGRTFAGKTDDFISNFAAATSSSILQSPTFSVSIPYLKSSLEWIEKNGEAHISTAGSGSIDADFDLQFQILSNNYDILKTGAGVSVDPKTTLAASDVQTRLVAWAKSIAPDKLTAFKNILNAITSLGSKRRTGLADALYKLL